MSKKIIALISLILVASMLLLSCGAPVDNGDGESTDDVKETTEKVKDDEEEDDDEEEEVTTEASTTEEITTEEVTTEEVTTEEVTTEATTTEEATTEEATTEETTIEEVTTEEVTVEEVTTEEITTEEVTTEEITTEEITTEEVTTEEITTEEITTEEPTTEGPSEDDLPYTVKESLMGEELSEDVFKIFEKSKILSYTVASPDTGVCVMGNITRLTDCTLTSVTIPVWQTGETDADGNFIITFHVFGSNFNALKRKAKRSYEIKINAEEYGLTENATKVRKAIKVDLTPYNITLSDAEALGYYSTKDTLIAAVFENKTGWDNNDNMHAAFKLVREKAPYMTGMFTKVGTSDMAYSQNTLAFDFEWEKTYEKKADYLKQFDTTEYDTMVEALLEKYQGKYVSVLGDSISTFRGVSNNGSSNSAISGNEPYYPDFCGNVYDYSLTYWGRVINELGMNTCVINSWSSSKAYGGTVNGNGVKFGKNMLIRAGELHRDNGTPNNPDDDIAPDVIIIYIGINDLSGGTPYDTELANIIAGGYSEAKMDAWFASVLARAESSGDEIVEGVTYQNFDQVYALSLNRMKELYPDAEIYCMTYQETNHSNITKERFDAFNNAVKALATYFGATVVDQSTDSITSNNCHAFGGDIRALHPNASGHAIAAENIMKHMYNKIKEQ